MAQKAPASESRGVMFNSPPRGDCVANVGGGDVVGMPPVDLHRVWDT